MAQSKMTQILAELGHLASWGVAEAPGRTNELLLSVCGTVWKMITFPVPRRGWEWGGGGDRHVPQPLCGLGDELQPGR